MLSTDLDQLTQAIEQSGFSIQSCLRPGLTSAQIGQHLAPINIPVPTVLRELYQWRDGTIENCSASLFDEHEFLPIGDAIDEYYRLLSVYQDDSEENSIDYASCFPFASFMGSYYVLYCNVQPLKGFQYPVIRIFQGTSISFINIEVMIQTIKAWYISGAYRMRTIDEQSKNAIWRNLNPGVSVP